MADAARSNRAIAELTGVQHNLVGDVRSVLDESSTIHRYEFPGSANLASGSAAVKTKRFLYR